MNKIKEFSPFLSDVLGYYVYLLIDPETNKTFYVGMTSANRYQLYYYTGGNGWSNAKLNDNCQLELFEDSFYEGGHPNDDETDGL